jgi:hypothetical protein
MRLSIPGASYFLGAYVIHKVDSSVSTDTQVATGLAIGTMIASAIDVALLSYDTVQIERRFDARTPPPPRVSPLLNVGRTDFTVGLTVSEW